MRPLEFMHEHYFRGLDGTPLLYPVRTSPLDHRRGQPAPQPASPTGPVSVVSEQILLHDLVEGEHCRVLKNERCYFVAMYGSEGRIAASTTHDLDSEMSPEEMARQLVHLRKANGAPKTLNALRDAVHNTAREKGWYDPVDGVGTDHPWFLPMKAAMVHSETSEFVEADRKHEGPERRAEEVVDGIFRYLDLAGFLGIDLEAEVARKLAANQERPRMHGGRKY